MNFFSEVFKRIMSDTPSFFKKIQLIGTGLAACGLSLAMTSNLPDVFSKIEGFLATAGAVMVAIGQLACVSPEKINNENK